MAKAKGSYEAPTPAVDKKKALQTALAQIEKSYGKGTDARPHLHHAVPGSRSAGVGNVPWNPVCNEKVLPHTLGKMKAMPGQQGLDVVEIGQFHNSSVLCISFTGMAGKNQSATEESSVADNGSGYAQ